MPTSTQSIRQLVEANPNAAGIFRRFDIDPCDHAEESLQQVCAALQLSVDQVLEKLEDTCGQDTCANFVVSDDLSTTRLIQHIVRIHHQRVRQHLPALAESARTLADRHPGEPHLQQIAGLVEALHARLLIQIGKEEQVLFPFISQMEERSVIAYPPAHACFRSLAHPLFLMAQEHESANLLTAELARLCDGFNTPAGACPTHTHLFNGLQSFQADLLQHTRLEVQTLYPRALQMEAALIGERSNVPSRY